MALEIPAIHRDLQAISITSESSDTINRAASTAASQSSLKVHYAAHHDEGSGWPAQGVNSGCPKSVLPYSPISR